jgi:carbon-monoxide dehydrogenase medium subunit
MAPDSLAEALQVKRDKGAEARVVSGATDLILRMRDGLLKPGVLIDLQRISLDRISSDEDDVRIGAAVILAKLLEDADIEKNFPALTEACRQFAGPPIRNRATLGGNIVNASPAADLVPPLMAYDASIVLSSTAGDRLLNLKDFFTGPGKTVMRPDELLTEIRMPVPPADSAACFIKLGQRRSMAISMVNVCTAIGLSADGVVNRARIVLGAVAPTPLHAVAAENLLTGGKLDKELIGKAADQAGREIAAITDARASASYRNRMAEVLVRRALTASWDSLRRTGKT